jgi:Na+-driven multidrug efflux pump
MLYFRQILIMLVSLYMVRVVLETLGAEDYGIYNVVAGVVTMFGFLSNSMAAATQRYLSFELGRNDFEQLRKVFSINLEIYILITVMTSPYMAAIIAHEDMNIYAGVSIAEVVLKLAIVILLRFILWDKLQLCGTNLLLTRSSISLILYARSTQWMIF